MSMPDDAPSGSSAPLLTALSKDDLEQPPSSVAGETTWVAVVYYRRSPRCHDDVGCDEVDT
eukprot:CAMPEP_0196147296 /NCGR_PEP_ID=MMETSP0910-20130528/25094_1 /TAXON_ID=49265 /ORGANISM="Thalassiosira rotula, Strain GSO102" /LENGTH=60 /DNA_ID=CAMNT_0041409679 /DNA_START=49 /DNA_END=229 /DNA_ORIENTATION=-